MSPHSSAFFRALASRVGLKNRPRNGKVARLPEPIRNQINLMLEDGLPYRAILDRLPHSTAPPLHYSLSEMNLSNWKNGGFQDWRLHRCLEVASVATSPAARAEAQLETAHLRPLKPSPAGQTRFVPHPVALNRTQPHSIAPIKA